MQAFCIFIVFKHHFANLNKKIGNKIAFIIIIKNITLRLEPT